MDPGNPDGPDGPLQHPAIDDVARPETATAPGTTAVTGAAPNQPDDPQQEEQAAYRIRIGRWKRESCEIVRDPLFWSVVRMQTVIHGPYAHHFNFLKSKLNDGDSHMALLVYGKADQILNEYNEMIAVPSFLDESVDMTAPISQQLQLIEFAVESIASHLCNYHRRVVFNCWQFPMMLHWLAFLPHDKACGRRKFLCRTIADTADERLEFNARKLKQLFGVDVFRAAAASGTCSVDLYCFGLALRKGQRSDVVLNEGQNSLLKAMTTNCRRIGLPLLSSRANIKRELGVGSRGAVQKWSLLRPGSWGLSGFAA